MLVFKQFSFYSSPAPMNDPCAEIIRKVPDVYDQTLNALKFILFPENGVQF